MPLGGKSQNFSDGSVGGAYLFAPLTPPFAARTPVLPFVQCLVNIYAIAEFLEGLWPPPFFGDEFLSIPEDVCGDWGGTESTPTYLVCHLAVLLAVYGPQFSSTHLVHFT
jgi:hypothetical protein